MRLTVDFAKTLNGWTLTYEPVPAMALAPRTLTSLAKPGDIFAFPIPPPKEKDLWSGRTLEDPRDATDLEILARALRQIALGDAKSDQLRRFGNYLTAVLLGPHMDEVWKAPPSEPIELYLRAAADDGSIQRLPWELMYRDDRPIAADEKHTVAIARIVPGVGERPKTFPMELPLKVLFVVGQVLDETIRPGAEYMAILRRVAGPAGDLRVVNINSRLLLSATPADVEKAVEELKPAVVHFICHGDFDKKGAFLLLAKKVGEVRTDAADPLYAKDLLDLLRRKPKDSTEELQVPSVVVLNACHTAEAAGSEFRKEAYRGYAAELVAGGIPMTVGMAGEVADGACRIFAGEFYQALLAGNSATMASARGRRAAMRKYAGDASKTEWARPSLFVASEAESKLTVGTKHAGLADAARFYLNINDPRALCGRLDCLVAFERLLQGLSVGKGRNFVLGFRVDEPTTMREEHTPKFGKSRLIEELAARLALAGIAPVLVLSHRTASRAHQDVRKAVNASELTARLADLMNETRFRFGVAERRPTDSMKRVLEKQGIDPNDPDAEDDAYRKLAAGEATLGSRQLSSEFRLLAKDLEEQGVSHVALLLDDLHTYSAFEPLLKMIGDQGLGEPSHVVPMIFTYVKDVGSDLIYQTMKNNGFTDVPLGRLGRTVWQGAKPGDPPPTPAQLRVLVAGLQDEILAHRQFLLTREGQPLAVGLRECEEVVGRLYLRLNQLTWGGIPSRWETDLVRVAIDMYWQDHRVLVEANDEEIVKLYG
jgi:hypothetical protein